MPPPPTVSASSAACVDVSQWSTPLLEKNARALQLQMAKYPNAATTADKELLANIERELSKRYTAGSSAATPPAAPKGKVELCERPADLPGNGKVGLMHWWLKTPMKEAGMGPAGGGIPGHKDGPSGYLGVPTTINDHKGEKPTSCKPLDKVDVDCVNRELENGKPTGRWAPPFNDCHTVVVDVVKKCAVDGVDPFAHEQNKQADAGVP
ncbi:MAG: hypothetical protein HYV09_21975 [Deltaproteobacteria bacterium]|nr:hypothetical protein [Deltaproteobacteria bacterium]